MQTTVGNILLNEILPSDLRRYDRIINKKTFMEIINDVGKKYPADYGRIVKNLKDLGDEYSTQLGSSFSLSDFKPNPVTQNIYKKYEKDYARIRRMPEGVQKDNLLRDLNLKVEDLINKKVSEDILSENNRFTLWGKVGAKGGPTNFRQMLYASGNQVDVKKELFPHMSKRSLSEGLAPSDFFITSLGARTGVVASFNSVRDPGAYSKELYASINDMICTAVDCGTKNGKIYPTTHPDAVDRYLAEDTSGFSRNTLVEPQIQDQLEKKGIHEIKVRTPLTCEAKEGLCSKCFGPNENGKDIPVGDTVGLWSAQSITEPLTQLALSAKHSGGVVGKKSAFEKINQLFHAPENFSGGAVLTRTTGIVSKLEKTPDGGTNVYIGSDKPYYVEPKYKILVKVGSTVNKGDPLSEGMVNPKEVTELKGIDAGRDYLAKAVRDVYKENNQDGHPKIFETIVKGTLNHGIVEDVGDHFDLTIGATVSWDKNKDKMHKTIVELTPIQSIGWRLAEGVGNVKADTYITDDNWVKLKSAKTVKVYKKPAKIRQLMVSTERNAMYNDFVSAMNFRNIKNVLTEATNTAGKANIHGTNPITAYAYGAEMDYREGGRF